MRWDHSSACTVVLLVSFCGVPGRCETPDGDPTLKASPELAQLIGAIRASEELYENLETSIERKVETADRRVPNSPLSLSVEEKRRTVRQGELIRFEGEETRLTPTGEKIVDRHLSTFDGRQTVSVAFGNSVNIHKGRYEAWQVAPPHCWTLAPWKINFPLSVFLEGTEAIHAHPKYQRHPVESGSTHEFPRVECWLDGEEEIDGLRCVRVQCKRWYRSKPGSIPKPYTLWIAPARDHLCVKAQSCFYRSDEVQEETIVEEMEEIAEGLWLPKRIVSNHYARPENGGRSVYRREVTELVHASAKPDYPLSFFQDSGDYGDLLVYHIVNDHLQDSPICWKKVEAGDENMKRILEALRTSEADYARIETKSRETYREVHEGEVSRMVGGGQMVSCSRFETTHRSVLDGERAFVDEVKRSSMADGTTSLSTTLYAFDGQWTRSLSTYVQAGHDRSSSKCYAGLQVGQLEHMSVWRPHSAVLRSLDKFRPLSEILESEKFGSLDSWVEYLGEQIRDGLLCDVLCLVGTSRKSGKPYLKEFLWLARDRGYLPVRNESYSLRWSDQLPTAITSVVDIREIAPNVYFPMHVVTNRFESYEKGGLADDRLVLRWQQEWIVDEVTVAPQVASALFEVVEVPPGTHVNVLDQEGDRIGSFKQRAAGNLFVTPEELEAMKTLAEAREREKKERLAAMDALIDQPAPAFPRAQWLNSEPLTWEQLKGKVVLLEFWAVWCGPCRSSLSQLAETYENLRDAGIVVIGIHTAGSEVENVQKLAEDEKLAFPLCIDVAPRSGRAWGDLFSKYAVHQIPCSYVIDKTGKVVAHGELRETLPLARGLVK